MLIATARRCSISSSTRKGSLRGYHRSPAITRTRASNDCVTDLTPSCRASRGWELEQRPFSGEPEVSVDATVIDNAFGTRGNTPSAYRWTDRPRIMVSTEAVSAVCDWCERQFRARRGGSPQRFCGPKCRVAFWSVLRRFGELALSDGVLTIADIRNGDPSACTLRRRTEIVARPPPRRCARRAGASVTNFRPAS